jgi:hypothetical protein
VVGVGFCGAAAGVARRQSGTGSAPLAVCVCMHVVLGVVPNDQGMPRFLNGFLFEGSQQVMDEHRSKHAYSSGAISV